jgi:hypothetical protein
MRHLHATALAALLLLARPLPADSMTDQLGAAVKDGSLRMRIALEDGKVPLGYGYTLETVRRPLLLLDTVARDGRVEAFCAHVDGGALVLRGKGLRPDFRIEELEMGSGGVITSARWKGETGWSRFVLSLVSGLAKKELGKLRFKTEIAALMRGELFAETAPPASKPAPKAAPPPGATPAPTPAPSASPRPAGPSTTDLFLRLVDDVVVADSTVTAFGGRALAFGDTLRLTTGTTEPIVLGIEEAIYRPEAATGVPCFRAKGTLDGAFGEGGLLWEKDRLAFSGGRLERARFLIEDGAASVNEVSASGLSLDLVSGRFPLASGIVVDLDAPSRFAARELAMDAKGVKAVLDLDILGRTGEIVRQGSRLLLKTAHVTSKGLRIEGTDAEGDVSLSFDYRLVHSLAVRYPVPELQERRVDLEFLGPFRADLHIGKEGGALAVTGRYVFSVNWPPIEKAAFEAIRARWTQDVSALRKVRFEIEPIRFAPCGEECFLARFRFDAVKVGSKRLSLKCAPEGQASLVLDKDAKAFVLKNVKTQPKCEGLLGKLVNLVAPLLTKTYDDMVIFKLPEDVPFTIDKVRSKGDELEIAGAILWRDDTK